MADALSTPLTRMLGCRLPVVQTAMGWIATPQLVIASSNAGAFGFIAGAVMTVAELAAAIQTVKGATPHHFGVNFHSFQPGAKEIVEVILANADRVRAVSFGRGPDADMIAKFRAAGIICMPTVGALKHAQKMVALGCQAVTIQGGEGGGHTGSVATNVLLPQVLDAVDVPVIAAGGYADGRGLVAALAYGAAGIAMGTRFMMTSDSPVPDATKAAYTDAQTTDIFVTSKIDGIPQRMIRNHSVSLIEQTGRIAKWRRGILAGMAMKRDTGASWSTMLKSARSMTKSGGKTLPEAMLAAAAPVLLQKAVVDGDAENGLMSAGMVAGRLTDLPSCETLLAGIEREAREQIAALTGLSTGTRTLQDGAA